jgi:CHAD domain-containing protein
MRYSLEFAEHLLGPQGEELILSLKQLQDDLGEFNDAVVSRSMIEALPHTLDTEQVKNYAHLQQQTLEQLRGNLITHLQAFLAETSRYKLAQAVAQI